jgi:phosphocarrier protein HPr
LVYKFLITMRYYQEDAGIGVASSSDLTRKVTIVNELGLHARPAAKIAQIARNASATVWVTRGPEQVDASSIIELLTLACEKGTTLTFTASDPADRHILEELVQLIESGFEE